jgi:TIR domain
VSNSSRLQRRTSADTKGWLLAGQACRSASSERHDLASGRRGQAFLRPSCSPTRPDVSSLSMDAATGADTSDGWLVFISHSGTDTWVARQIARVVTECGATPFLDEAGIGIGADFEDDILAFLAEADELVVLLTPWALDRPYVWAELGAAWGRRIPIVALLLGLEETDLHKRPGVPVLLKRRNLVPLNDVDRYLKELRARVQSPPEVAT